MRIGIWLEKEEWEAVILSMKKVAWIPPNLYKAFLSALRAIEKRVEDASHGRND